MIYTYIVTLPAGINECVVPCLDGHTVYLSDRLDHAGRIRAYKHALKHINGNDWNKTDVQEIEKTAHPAATG